MLLPWHPQSEQIRNNKRCLLQNFLCSREGFYRDNGFVEKYSELLVCYKEILYLEKVARHAVFEDMRYSLNILNSSKGYSRLHPPMEERNL